MHNSPTIKATRDRFYIFKNKLQHFLNRQNSHERAADGDIKPFKMVSVPCGLMDDLLSLDFKNKMNIEIYGIDLDEQSLELASGNTLKYSTSLQSNNVDVKFIKANAWEINQNDHFFFMEPFDVLTSNGLNIYEKDDHQVVELYRQFRFLLKAGGILITSFIVPPTEWEVHSKEDAVKSKVIFADIIQVNWATYRTEELTRQQLNDAGRE